MPPTRTAQRSGRTAATSRAASVPVSRPENPTLESLRSKKQRSQILDGEDLPPSFPSVVNTRARRRNSSFGATDCIPSTSVALTAPVPEASEQRPRKKQKRPSSTLATLWSSQVFVQPQLRSRASSPATDVEYNPPRRTSVRLARKLRSLLDNRSSDIYTHLADPDGAGDLLSKPPAGSVVSSTLNEIANSQSVQKRRGRRRRTVDLADENAKKDLIEEWARIRRSEGSLSLLSLDDSARFSRMQLRNRRKDNESLEPIAQARSPDAHTTETQVLTLDDSLSPRMDAENTLSANKDADKMNHVDSTLPSEGGTEQPIAPGVDIEAAAPLILSPHVGKGSPNGERMPETTQNPDLLQHPIPKQMHSVPRAREDSAVPTSEQAASLDGPPPDSHSDVVSPARSFDKSTIRLDSDQEFYMLDVSEILTFPWEPVTSHLYVPPSLGKLISGMREQLTIESRARQRAEDLYEAELSRRLSAEKMIKDLREELERKTSRLIREI